MSKFDYQGVYVTYHSNSDQIETEYVPLNAQEFIQPTNDGLGLPSIENIIDEVRAPNKTYKDFLNNRRQELYKSQDLIQYARVLMSYLPLYKESGKEVNTIVAKDRYTYRTGDQSLDQLLAETERIYQLPEILGNPHILGVFIPGATPEQDIIMRRYDLTPKQARTVDMHERVHRARHHRGASQEEYLVDLETLAILGEHAFPQRLAPQLIMSNGLHIPTTTEIIDINRTKTTGGLQGNYRSVPKSIPGYRGNGYRQAA